MTSMAKRDFTMLHFWALAGVPSREQRSELGPGVLGEFERRII
jgi:hypothetical protein